MRHVSLRLDKDVYEYLDAESERTGRPFSQVHRDYLEFAIQLEKIANEKNLSDKREIFDLLRGPNFFQQSQFLAQSEALFLLRELSKQLFNESHKQMEQASEKAMSSLKKTLEKLSHDDT